MPLRRLTQGLREFQEQTFAQRREFFARLEIEQRPKVMMIACSDSRIDPGIVLKAEPGELFMVRNVANLVPPHRPDQQHHGTSAALDFGVNALKVQHIIVFGHAGCGGIRALLTRQQIEGEGPSFIQPWLNIADEARRRTLLIARQRPLEEQLRLLEEEAIKTSLANLLTFPWIEAGVAEGRLRVHGWLFDLHDGEVRAYIPASNSFEQLTPALAAELSTLAGE
ncbi:MAG: carbonic anhydrase [Pseudomonadota bacterium]